jgi:hypothetical protein
MAALLLAALLTLLAALTGLLARLLLSATLLLARLTRLWIVLLLLVRVLVLLRHFLLLGGSPPDLNQCNRSVSVPDGTRAIVRWICHQEMAQEHLIRFKQAAR